MKRPELRPIVQQDLTPPQQHDRESSLNATFLGSPGITMTHPQQESQLSIDSLQSTHHQASSIVQSEVNPNSLQHDAIVSKESVVSNECQTEAETLNYRRVYKLINLTLPKQNESKTDELKPLVHRGRNGLIKPTNALMDFEKRLVHGERVMAKPMQYSVDIESTKRASNDLNASWQPKRSRNMHIKSVNHSHWNEQLFSPTGKTAT
jgi:hypothetical protein